MYLYTHTELGMLKLMYYFSKKNNIRNTKTNFNHFWFLYNIVIVVMTIFDLWTNHYMQVENEIIISIKVSNFSKQKY